MPFTRGLWRGERANSVMIILTLAVGMAAVTLVYSIFDAMLLRPLPFGDHGRASLLWTRDAKGGFSLSSPARLLDLARDARRWEAISGFYTENMNLAAIAGKPLPAPERIHAVRTIPNFAAALRVQPALGRWPTLAEEKFGGPKTALLAHAFWLSHFDADRDVLGKTLQINGDLYTVVGVAPDGFRFPSAEAKIFLPGQLHPNLLGFRNARFLVGLGLRHAGVPESVAAAELTSLLAAYGQRFGPDEAAFGLSLEEPRAYLVGKNTRRSIVLLAAAVALLLAIAIVNAANLMTARGLRRQRDHALRLALGARRRSLVFAILRDSLSLSLLAAALGCLISAWAIDFVSAYWKTLPTFHDLRLDWRVALATLAIASAAGLLAALAPAWQAARRDTLLTLRQTASAAQLGGHARWRRLLVAIEVALCTVLLSGAFALGHSLRELNAVPLGFARQGLLTFEVSLPWETSPAQRQEFFRQLQRRFAESPWVQQVAYADHRPLDVSDLITVRPPSGPPRQLRQVNASPDYFELLGLSLRQGRAFSLADRPGRPVVGLLNETAARQLFGDSNPVGRILSQRWGQQDFPVEIVGVLADARTSFREPPPPILYKTNQEDQWPSPTFFVKTRGDSANALLDLRKRLAALRPGQALQSVQSMESYLDAKSSEPRLSFLLVAVFGAAAALLAFLGLFGVLTWYVTARTNEIGVRMALGARLPQILALVVRQGTAPVLAGLTAGVMISTLALQASADFLYRSQSLGPWPFASAAACLLVLSLLALALPAYSAARIDPQAALRQD